MLRVRLQVIITVLGLGTWFGAVPDAGLITWLGSDRVHCRLRVDSDIKGHLNCLSTVVGYHN